MVLCKKKTEGKPILEYTMSVTSAWRTKSYENENEKYRRGRAGKTGISFL